jgi:5-methylcytosine-specific restriction enzyme subunit McrC
VVIQVFEHQRLLLSDVFKVHHLNVLLKFNDEHGNKYFSVVHRGVKFSHYVGVLQVGDLTIEILPKVDQFAKGDIEQWRSVLLEMLRYTRLLKVETVSKAPLLLSQQSLLDIYLNVFLAEVRKLLRKGLVKQYQKVSENRKAMKGALVFQSHIQQNLIRKERFYTQTNQYETNYLLHQLLVKALKIVASTTYNTSIKRQCRQLLMQFPKVDDVKVYPQLFQNIRLNRKTQHYDSALNLAQLILLNYCPDLKSGDFDILAILIDMNKLFEEYIFEALRKVVFKNGYTIKGQPSTAFWEDSTSLRPDIVIQTPQKNIVLDTKWKILKKSTPESEDLKQMFVYGHYFKAAQNVLIYPKTKPRQQSQQGIFHQKMYDEEREKMIDQRCDLIFVEILKNGHLNKQIGVEILENLGIQNP